GAVAAAGPVSAGHRVLEGEGDAVAGADGGPQPDVAEVALRGDEDVVLAAVAVEVELPVRADVDGERRDAVRTDGVAQVDSVFVDVQSGRGLVVARLQEAAHSHGRAQVLDRNLA